MMTAYKPFSDRCYSLINEPYLLSVGDYCFIEESSPAEPFEAPIKRFRVFEVVAQESKMINPGCSCCGDSTHEITLTLKRKNRLIVVNGTYQHYSSDRYVPTIMHEATI